MKTIWSDYYDNPNRIMIGVDIVTLTDVFENNYEERTGKPFDWEKDGDIFNEISRDLDLAVEECFAKKFNHTAVAESYDDDAYILTFWGDKNDPEDIENLKVVYESADDTWRDNGRVYCAIYDSDYYLGGGESRFIRKWDSQGYGEIAEDLIDSVNAAVDFPEEYAPND